MRGRTFGALGALAAVCFAIGAYAVMLTLFGVSSSALDPSQIVSQGIGGGLLLAGLVGGPVRALSYARLKELGNPQDGNVPQAIRHVFYDTDTITTAVTRTINYFTQARANRNLTNFGTPGQLTADQYFEICYLGFDILGGASETAAATAASGIGQDIQQIMLQQQPTFLVDYNSKNYGPYPLSFLHTSGGAVGVIASGATAPDLQVFNNGVTDGGWNWGGGLILCPSVQFGVVVSFAAAPTITQGPLSARFWMEGILSRAIV